MRGSAQPERRRRPVLKSLLGGLLLAAALAVPRAGAAPARLGSEAEIAAFAAQVRAFSGAERVRWVVAAPTLADANAVVERIGRHFAAPDRSLLSRIKTQVTTDGETGPVGWIEPKIGSTSGDRSCSWQVWVSDPSTPSEDSGPVAVPLTSGDRYPVNPGATFRVGFTGLLQSKIYAFGETSLGDIRDLSRVPDLNIPVDASAPELLVLVRARQPVPFFDRIQATLGETRGERRDLGHELALRDKVMGQRRGIGANIQLIAPGMIVNAGGGAAPSRDTGAKPDGMKPDDMAETCLFSLMPADTALQ